MLRGGPWHRHRHHPRGSSRPDTPGTALCPQSLPPVAPGQFGVLHPDLLHSGSHETPRRSVLAILAQRGSWICPESPRAGDSILPQGTLPQPGASCGHRPAPLLLTGFALLHPRGEHRTAGNITRSPAAHQRPQGTAPRRDGHSRLEKQRRTSWDGELGHKVQSRTKPRKPVRGDPRAQPAPSGPRGGSHSRGWPRSSPRGCRPPPPPPPGAAPECK